MNRPIAWWQAEPPAGLSLAQQRQWYDSEARKSRKAANVATGVAIFFGLVSLAIGLSSWWAR